MYFASFEKDMKIQEKNYVMAYVSNDDFEMISKAYSNYVLVKHNFYLNLMNILSNDSNDKNTNKNSYKLLIFCKLYYCYIRILELSKLIKSFDNYNKNYDNEKYDKWRNRNRSERQLISEIHANYDVRRFRKRFFFLYLKLSIKLSFLEIRVSWLLKKKTKINKQ